MNYYRDKEQYDEILPSTCLKSNGHVTIMNTAKFLYCRFLFSESGVTGQLRPGRYYVKEVVYSLKNIDYSSYCDDILQRHFR